MVPSNVDGSKNHLSEMDLINSTSIQAEMFLDFTWIIRSLRYFIYKALNILVATVDSDYSGPIIYFN